ncbi:MAG: M15 family metallopeptidase [Treponema sp.]|nr:M15 family metallopeptidase [Treponema sp.]
MVSVKLISGALKTAVLEVKVLRRVFCFVKIPCWFFLLAVFFLPPSYAGGKAERSSQPVQGAAAKAEAITAADSALLDTAETSAAFSAPPAREIDRGELVMKALAAAYPDRVSPAVMRNGDWALTVYGEWYYYADGRLLPEALVGKAAEYDPQPFYQYAAELPPWTDPTEEESLRMREMMERRRKNPAKRSHHFYDALFRAHNRDESWERVKQIHLFGLNVVVHYSILEDLSLVEEKILALSKTNSEVRRWIAGLKSIDGWNWRNIAETSSRSFHSYGAAIDFLPKSLGGLETYWQWTAQHNPAWWTVPYSRRFHPPKEVIEAFESCGFIWGGKWRTFDTMHFEYRPEILIFSKIPQAVFR